MGFAHLFTHFSHLHTRANRYIHSHWLVSTHRSWWGGKARRYFLIPPFLEGPCWQLWFECCGSSGTCRASSVLVNLQTSHVCVCVCVRKHAQDRIFNCVTEHTSLWFRVSGVCRLLVCFCLPSNIVLKKKRWAKPETDRWLYLFAYVNYHVHAYADFSEFAKPLW